MHTYAFFHVHTRDSRNSHNASSLPATSTRVYLYRVLTTVRYRTPDVSSSSQYCTYKKVLVHVSDRPSPSHVPSSLPTQECMPPTPENVMTVPEHAAQGHNAEVKPEVMRPAAPGATRFHLPIWVHLPTSV